MTKACGKVTGMKVEHTSYVVRNGLAARWKREITGRLGGEVRGVLGHSGGRTVLILEEITI